MSELEKSVAPILAAQKLLGLFPVNSSYTLDVGLVATNFMLVQIVIAASLVYKCKVVFIDHDGQWSSLAEFATVCVVSSICALWVTHNRHHVAAYMDDCRKTHDRFVSLQFRPNYPRKKNLAEIQLFALVTVPLVVFDVFIYDYKIMTETYLVVYNLADAINFLEILLFSHLVAIARTHLNLINRFLKVKKVHVLWGRDRDVFGELTKIFHEVHGSCKSLNAAFSVPLLCLTSMAFVCMLIDAFHAFKVLTESLRYSDVELPVLKFVSRIIWVAYQVYKMYLLVESCSSLQDEAKSFSVELREILATADPKQIIETEDLIRTHHLLYKKVDFTAADFYEVDFSLILSIVAAVGSYLVILIQFGTSRPLPTPSPDGSSEPVPNISSLAFDLFNSTTPATAGK